MDKYISAKLDSFNFSKSQKELFVDIITYVATKAVAGGIDLSNFATKNDLHNSVHGLELDINTVRDTAAEANRIANNNIDKINNINDNIIPNFYTKTETDKKVDDRIQQVVGAAPEALDTLEEIATRLEGDSDAINTINGVLEGKVSNTTFNEYKETVYTKTEAYSINQVDNLLNNINTNVDNKIAQVPKKFRQLEDVYVFPGDISIITSVTNINSVENILGPFDDVHDAWNNNKLFISQHNNDSAVLPGKSNTIVSVSFASNTIVFSYLGPINNLGNHNIYDGSVIILRINYYNGHYTTVRDKKYVNLSKIDDNSNQISTLNTELDKKANIHILNNIDKLTNNSTFQETFNVLGDISNLKNTINNSGIIINRHEEMNLNVIENIYRANITGDYIYIYKYTNNIFKTIKILLNSYNFEINVSVIENVTKNNFNSIIQNTNFRNLGGIYMIPGDITTIDKTTTAENLISVLGVPSTLKNVYADNCIIIDINNTIINVTYYDNYFINISYRSKDGAFYKKILGYDIDADSWNECTDVAKYGLVDLSDNITRIDNEITQINDKILEYHPVSVDTGSGNE